MAEQIVSVQNLQKTYEGQRVIDGLSFSIHEGERLALFAPSGAGKTTLISILAGLEKPDSGRVSVADKAPIIIFQEPRLFPFLNVEENIFLPFKIANRSITPEVNKRFLDWLEVCDLGRSVHLYPYQLSGGMRQKVSIVRGLLGLPHFVMLDEPFQSVNFAAKKAIIEHILETQPQVTLLFVTHIAEEVPMLAQRVMYFTDSCLEDPEFFEAGSLKEKLSKPNSLIIHNEKDQAFSLDAKKKETL